MRIILTSIFLVCSSVLNASNTMIVTVDVLQPQFSISLPANPTTGYQWTIKQLDKKVATLATSQYIRPDSSLIGAGGTMVFTFDLVKLKEYPKKTTVIFKYARPWESKSSGTLQYVTLKFKG